MAAAFSGNIVWRSHATDRRCIPAVGCLCSQRLALLSVEQHLKFPYIAGENGGGAFVLIYLVCVAFVGAPIMISEVMLGRKGRASPINTMGTGEASGASGRWGFVGWMGVLAGVLILSYYAVIAGWALNYVWLTLQEPLMPRPPRWPHQPLTNCNRIRCKWSPGIACLSSSPFGLLLAV